MKNKRCFFSLAGIFVLFAHLAVSQVEFRSMEASEYDHHSQSRVSNAERDSSQIFLPFWDDFSRTSYLPDSNHWFIDPGTTIISSSLGIAPPTLNVAAFDGWNNQGVPYSDQQLQEGQGDSLVSRFIDMSAINPALFETAYISFFWQKEGRGEAPDEGDSIRLQALNSEKKWITIWSKAGADVSVTDRFFAEIVAVGEAAYFHEYFQFRFQSFGRLSGGFDTWNIDYVYFNINRNGGDLVFEDRALTTNPSSWLNTYTALPYDHFIINLEDRLSTASSGISNLDDQVQPIEFYSLIRDTIKVFDEMNQGTPFNLAPQAQAEIVSEPVDPNTFDREADSLSLQLETKFYITSGDSANWLNKYDLRVNDSTTSKVMLDTELAYDDGTAEWAAGLSQQAGMLAYRFVIPKPDIITSVNIYFPEFAPSSAGKSFTLIVWDDIFRYREGRQLTEQHTVKRSTSINEFTNYELGRPVAVEDTFYVGYEQSVADFFPIGLDKNSAFQEGNVFINLDGVWESTDDIEGNLMIRSVFGFEAAVGLEDEIFEGVAIYPNPSDGTFNIKGSFDQAWVFDVLGTQIMLLDGSQTEQEFELLKESGVYFLKILKQGKYKTYKLVIN